MTTEHSSETPPRKRDLTVTKVLAGAGAAATSAVLGSFFGAEGTVFGAAFGSVASTVATTIYQHSLDRTRETLVARVRVRRPGESAADASDVATVRLPRPPADASGSDVEPDLAARPNRRRLLVGIGATVLAFVLAMVVVTTLELAKGSTLAGNDSGTSVGRVVAPPAADPAPAEESGSADTTATDAPGAGEDATTTATPDPDAPGFTQNQNNDEPPATGDVRPTGQDVPSTGGAQATPGTGTSTGN